MNTKAFPHQRLLPVLAGGLAVLVLAGCERPPMDAQQTGFRGVALEQVTNPRIEARLAAANVAPDPLPPAAPVPTPASAVYQNLQILGDLPLTEFTRLMAAITSWVAPTPDACVYCHNLDNMASDEKYTKVVARSMLQLTQHTNEAWKSHVAETGVTCYTCHRGNAVPQYVWTTDPGPAQPRRFVATGQNIASPTVAYASLPFDPLTAFLDDDQPISVVSETALPEGYGQNIKQAEWTYGLMMHISDSLGVNCTYCHNSRSFYAWDQSSTARFTAWYAIRHVRDINRNYIWPLNDILPDSRKGPLGDPKRVACVTCHQGVNKPLLGAPMLKDYPALATVTGAKAEPAPAASEPPPAAPIRTDAEDAVADEAKLTERATAEKPLL